MSKREREISSQATGAASELIVCADLLMKGYYVHRSVSASCPFDLVIWKDRNFASVEVKTKQVANRVGRADGIDADVLAEVVQGTVFYTLLSSAEIDLNPLGASDGTKLHLK